jgi:hypothetical protein
MGNTTLEQCALLVVDPDLERIELPEALKYQMSASAINLARPTYRTDK